MYFEIDNTPEHIRKSRRVATTREAQPKEEIPRLVIAPFSRPPQVVFENVPIGTTCEREFELYNPSEIVQAITLGKDLPDGLVVHLPEECLALEPNTCYSLTMGWTPMQPTAQRKTIRFTDDNRGRFDVIVVLKSAVNIKSKGKKKATYKTSPGKIKKKKSPKKSPVSIYKKKVETIYNTTKVMKTIHHVQTVKQHTVFSHSITPDKENVFGKADFEHKNDSYCPFGSPNSTNINFDFESEKFNNFKTIHTDIIQQTSDNNINLNQLYPQNILKPSNRQNFDNTVPDIFENLTFTPLKTAPLKPDKFNIGPEIIFSKNNDESDFDHSLNMKCGNKENSTQSIMCITSNQESNKWINNQKLEFIEAPILQNKNIPKTSSPKEFNSPNFSINTDFSRISDLSFLPQRCSTERKIVPKNIINNETHEIIDDSNAKVSSDTFTKESPNNVLPMGMGAFSMEHHVNHGYAESRPPHYFQPKVCRQSLFREFQQQRDTCAEKNHLKVPMFETDVWQNQLRVDTRSPPRSITPPLKSIPEESSVFFDRTDKQMDTLITNRTFDKPKEGTSISHSTRQSWSKKAVRAESELWKVPTQQLKKIIKSKPIKKHDSTTKVSIYNSTLENNKSITPNLSINHIGNVYTQSSTVDPFLSTTYFYDEEAVDKFETEFKRWLNYILTPPADLESNIEQKIDVGKAWIENRNKEVPLAPTKEQVCSNYHNSHRLDSLRRAAKTLLVSPEISQVFQKLNVQIEKKLIAIRTDKNLHLDVGLQKIIMEVLLSYNPLWLRIGLEAIYGTVIPLKSNSDIEGLTTFIIQRMFRNPCLKNKTSKSNAPNMLLPAYMEKIKKFTLKKFFMLVFLLDQAKQKKLIPHDPCLFCRNAICKDSREILIRFTRELIAGIGDITRHLRPLGYIVSHKQSYLDEYKYAVHNIAVDIRDGVRLTKVMEIILIKNGLTNQLRTPAITRLQKIHNVQVALNALKEADFKIVGNITANDIADGHREKTLSLLWQLIHVFRAPLFVTAANVIQIWWRKKFQVIKAKKMEEKRILQQKNDVASVIQFWWRKIQNNRSVEREMQKVTFATIVIQKNIRMWLCKTRLRKLKTNVLKIEKWFRSVKLMREAMEALQRLRSEKEELRRTAAIKIQSHVRRWICVRKYDAIVSKIIVTQSIVRCFLMRRRYLELKKKVEFVQEKYRGKLLMKEEMRRLDEKRKRAIIIQSFYRMYVQRKLFKAVKRSVKVVEERYIALIKMRRERENFIRLKQSAIFAQSLYRGRKARLNYAKQRNAIVKLQRRVRANQQMKKDKANFVLTKASVTVIQTRFRAYVAMKKERQEYIAKRNAALIIQKHFRNHLLAKAQRNSYLQLKDATIVLQKHYKGLIVMRQEREKYLKLKQSAIILQRRFKALILMRKCRENYLKIHAACLTIQQRFRALMKMRKQRDAYLKLKTACIVIQNKLRARNEGRKQKKEFLDKKEAALAIQKWYRGCVVTKEVKEKYKQTREACVTIQKNYRAYIIGKKQRQEYLRIKTATVCIQKYFRQYLEMKTVREEFVQLKTATVIIQRYFRAHIESKKQRDEYMRVREAAIKIQNYFRQYRIAKITREKYCQLRKATICIQTYYRNLCQARKARADYRKLKNAALTIQLKYKALLAMRRQRLWYEQLKSSVLIIQRRYRAQVLMKKEKSKFSEMKTSCIAIQKKFRAYTLGRKKRAEYLKLKQAAVTIQQRYRALIAMRKAQNDYKKLKQATVIIQQRFRAQLLMLKERSGYRNILNATCLIQKRFRAHLMGKKQREEYIKLKSAALVLQRRYRLIRQCRIIRERYLTVRKTVLFIQRRLRAKNSARKILENNSAQKIQAWYKSVRARIECRRHFLEMRKSAITIQSTFRMYIVRRKFFKIKTAAVCIQKSYRSYVVAKTERENYLRIRSATILMQAHFRGHIARKTYLKLRTAAITVQRAFRAKKERDAIKKRRHEAAICIQKKWRSYSAKSRYLQYREKVIVVQQIWKSKLLTRLVRCEFLQKRRAIIKVQAAIRGYLARKEVKNEFEKLAAAKEERKLNQAASKIQALFRGHRVRTKMASDRRVTELRRRWREGALRSSQQSLRERNVEALYIISNMCDFSTMIGAFKSLNRLTEVYPMLYVENAASVARRVFVCMSVVNRSLSSVEFLKYAASVLVNLTRYRVTGPKIYARDDVTAVLKMMLRFSNSETELLCILCTYLWLFNKYDGIREDLREHLHKEENHKMMVTIKANIDRVKRMSERSTRNRLSSTQAPKHNNSMKQSVRDAVNTSVPPALEPDFSILKVDKPRWFNDAYQAISCLFRTFNL